MIDPNVGAITMRFTDEEGATWSVSGTHVPAVGDFIRSGDETYRIKTATWPIRPGEAIRVEFQVEKQEDPLA